MEDAMAIVTLTSAFDTENFWAPRLGSAIVKSSATYGFQSDFGFVRVTGTGFTYGLGPLSEVIVDGDYTTITVFKNSDFTGTIASYGSATSHQFELFFNNGSSDGFDGADTINGSSGSDKITSHGGGDALDGKGGSDTYVVDDTDLVVGWSLTDTGASGTDTLRLASGSDFDLRTKSVSGIEAVVFTGVSGDQVAECHADQLPGDGLPARLAVTGVNGSQQVIVISNATQFSAALWTFKSWEAAADHVTINGTDGVDTLVGSKKNDFIRAGLGNDTLTGGGGKDVLGGSDGTDTFDFNHKSESAKGVNRDVIEDFSGHFGSLGELDLIDLSGIDAKEGPHNQAFHYIGAHHFQSG
jgi:Ca2+-binding RTX toxin-like protein